MPMYTERVNIDRRVATLYKHGLIKQYHGAISMATKRIKKRVDIEMRPLYYLSEELVGFRPCVVHRGCMHVYATTF